MFIKEPIYYYSIIRKRFPNSYLTEDERQIIIGIDCDYVDSYEYDFKMLKNYYNLLIKKGKIAPFAGLFGTFSYETVHYFEKIKKIENSQFEFPKFIFANAKAYLHYSKVSKDYSFYGNKKYFDNLKKEAEKEKENKKILKIKIREKKKFIILSKRI
ncbi:hypothetical protein [Leptotrichia sp. oral taxon 847]|uniref:hypothetical protein n=1 Tax=Leptotrichia sp. oral taxon 847 TaxID=1785996 RepID=UPI000A78D7B9|nr:hypothetical protein [Leptotrichia sp. oral taxon 847]